MMMSDVVGELSFVAFPNTNPFTTTAESADHYRGGVY